MRTPPVPHLVTGAVLDVAGAEAVLSCHHLGGRGIDHLVVAPVLDDVRPCRRHSVMGAAGDQGRGIEAASDEC